MVAHITYIEIYTDGISIWISRDICTIMVHTDFE